MYVQLRAIGVTEEARPVAQAEECVVEDDPGTVALACAARVAYNLVCLQVAGKMVNGKTSHLAT